MITVYSTSRQLPARPATTRLARDVSILVGGGILRIISLTAGMLSVGLPALLAYLVLA